MALLEYSVALDARRDVEWRLTVTSSDCGMQPEDIFVGLESAPNDYGQFPAALDAGQHNVAFIIGTEAPCNFAGKARLATSEGAGDGTSDDGTGGEGTGGDGSGGDGTGGGGTGDGGAGGDGAGGDGADDGNPDPALPPLTIAQWHDVEWQTEDWGDGQFGRFEDRKMSLGATTSLFTQSSSWSSDCAFADFDGPFVLLKDGDDFTSLPDSLPAGDYVVRLMVVSTRVCNIGFSVKVGS